MLRDKKKQQRPAKLFLKYGSSQIWYLNNLRKIEHFFYILYTSTIRDALIVLHSVIELGFVRGYTVVKKTHKALVLNTSKLMFYEIGCKESNRLKMKHTPERTKLAVNIFGCEQFFIKRCEIKTHFQQMWWCACLTVASFSLARPAFPWPAFSPPPINFRVGSSLTPARPLSTSILPPTPAKRTRLRFEVIPGVLFFRYKPVTSFTFQDKNFLSSWKCAQML